MSKRRPRAGADRLGRTRLGISLLAALAALASFAGSAMAAENGIGFYLLGSRGPMAGYIPPPGFYFQNDFYVYSGDLGASRSLPTGGKIVAGVRGDVQAYFATGTMVTPIKVLGGNWVIGGAVPFGHARANATLELNGPILGSRGRSITDNATVFGDPVGTTAIGWHAGNFHWNITGLVNFPIGQYRTGEIANLSFNRWAGDISAAGTWFDPAIGIDLSTSAGFTFNGENPAANYRTGTEFHVEWAATKMLTKELSAGIVGYHYQQITGDSGPGAVIGPFKGRVTALGGTIGYNFVVDKTPVSTRVKVFREFDTENRVQGTTGTFTVAFPLSGGG